VVLRGYGFSFHCLSKLLSWFSFETFILAAVFFVVLFSVSRMGHCPWCLFRFSVQKYPSWLLVLGVVLLFIEDLCLVSVDSGGIFVLPEASLLF
jgi:hypothetical protein